MSLSIKWFGRQDSNLYCVSTARLWRGCLESNQDTIAEAAALPLCYNLTAGCFTIKRTTEFMASLERIELPLSSFVAKRFIH